MPTNPSTSRRRRIVRPLASGVAALLLVAACGSEVPHDELAAALRVNEGAGTPGSSAAAPGVNGTTPSAGAATTGGPALDGSATSSNPGTGGSSGSDGGVDASGPAATGGCTGSETPIIIGTVGQQSGLAGAALANGPRAVAAWASAINARGGLNCHPVRYIIADDGGDPARNQSLVQDMVERQGVVAFVHMNAPLTAPASTAYLNQHNIPVIGSEGGLDYVYESPLAFPQAASGSALVATSFIGIAPLVTSDERSGLGILVCLEAETCSTYAQQGPAAAQDAGFTVVFNGTATLTQPDYTSQCLNARNAGVKVLWVSLDPNSLLRLARSCASVQFRPRYAVSPAATNTDLIANDAFDGLVTSFTVRPYVIDDPVLAEFRNAMATHAPGVPLDFAGNLGWASAKLFELGAMRTPDPTTSAGIAQGMQSIQGEDLGGLIGPVSFAAGQNAPAVKCWWSVIVDGGDFVSPDGGARVCQ